MKKSHKFDVVYDVRVVEKNVREGYLSKKDYEKLLKSLEDVEEKGEPLVIEDEEDGEENLEAAAEIGDSEDAGEAGDVEGAEEAKE